MKQGMGKRFFSLLLTLLLVVSLIPINAQAAPKVDKPRVDVSDFINKNLVNLKPLERVFISPSIDTKTDKFIRVIVELDQNPISVERNIQEQNGFSFTKVDERQVLNKISNAQAEFTSSLKKLQLPAKVVQEYQYVFNGVVVELPGKSIPMLAKAKNVKGIYPVVEYYALPIETKPMMSESGPFVGSTAIWDLGYKGEGIKVGVIDTGIDYYHPDLVDAYVGGYDFVDDDPDPYETLPGNPAGEATSHGTHVSGIIAGQHVQDNGIYGIAPEVDLYVYRVLGPGGSGTSDDVISGIEQAVVDGMDVINLSLGNDLNDPDYPTSVALNNAMLAGTIAVTSAGNSGPNRWTIGSPAASAYAITVGASTPPGDRPLATGVSSLDENLTYDLRIMAYDPTQDYQTLLNQPLEMVYVGLAYPEDFEGLDLTGKIAFVKRGEIPFVDKIANAKAAGAVAILMFNRDGLDDHIGYYLGDSVNFIPTFDMRGDEGRALLEMINNNNSTPTLIKVNNENLKIEKNKPIQEKPGVIEKAQPIKSKEKVKSSTIYKAMDNDLVTFTLTGFSNERYLGDELASFSSRGPVKKTLDIKPDVLAPGVSIRSTVAAYGGDYTNAYERYQGTSMASPHVAGLAALVKQAHPDYSPFDVKAALMNTSTLIGDFGEYTVFQQGSGRVQGLEAVTTPVLVEVLDKTEFTVDGELTEMDDITGSISFGHAPLDADFNDTKTILLKNVDGNEHSYTVDIQFLNQDTTGVTLTVDQENITVPANGQVEVTAEMFVDHTLAQQDEYQGYIYFTDENGNSVHVPFVVYVGDIDMPKGFGEVFQYPEDFSPNGDGILDTTGIYVEIYSEMDSQMLLVWDPIAYYEGYNYGYIGEIAYWEGEDTIPPGFWVIPDWDGTYYDFRTDEYETLRDGFYTLDWYGFDEEGSYVVWNDLYVDTVAPSIQSGNDNFNVDDSSFTFEGNVEDMYVLFEELDKVAVTYDVYAEDGTMIEVGEVGLNEDGSFLLTLSDLPEGDTNLTFYTADIAGNTGETSFVLNYPKTAELEGTTEADIGGTYEVSLVADGVDNLVGAQVEIAYDDSVFTLESVTPSEAFMAGAGEDGVVELVNEDLGYTDDGLKLVTVGVAYKNEVEGLSGKNQLLKVTFNVANDYTNLDEQFTFVAQNAKFVNKDLVEYLPQTTSNAEVTLLSTLTMSGVMLPEAFMVDDELNSEVDFTAIGATLTSVNDKGELVNGMIDPDGTFVFERVSPFEQFNLELKVPGHFRSVLEDVQAQVEVEGVLQPASIVVDFGLQLAGDVNGDDVIDIWDVVAVARFFGMEKTDGLWPNEQAGNGDLNQDGQIDILDLSFVTSNFAMINQLVPEVNTTPLLEMPEDLDLSSLQN
ncbi:hypothetical protein BHF71_02885 [Vulcanibacillus modesticaldus]|uniref:Dockerin domain-containing protein n=1 Tax=Vulcanibacillus modesticaldus TaxID=337097 RepID=A0A1D2YT76_9BACI|nr:S8 family serine peptidase [Vulcanibacillus modesticaldus]OEF98889.1 hypothetical protein BHF71_02885 [Vulcanibacillus modesticaldus]